MIEAIIFDMDGVVIDSEDLWAEAYRRQLAKRGLEVPTSASYRRFVNTHYRGRNQRHAIMMMQRFYGITDPYHLLYRERVKFLLSIFDEQLKLIPGIRGLLAKVSRRFPLALASSSPHPVIAYVLKRYQLKKYFSAVVSGDDFRHSKPSPEIFLTTARKLHTPPERCLVIEDTLSGVVAAHRARMRCIGLKQRYNSARDLQKADRMVQRLTQITIPVIQSL
ncbi:MAG: HAD family phosphatase [Candidatus Kerfeldbacteria bacterium]|nr:HAD family phosphatase [Candidatus Kerfeldbacteria bacterium]